jgi:hypothetical protein
MCECVLNVLCVCAQVTGKTRVTPLSAAALDSGAHSRCARASACAKHVTFRNRFRIASQHN